MSDEKKPERALKLILGCAVYEPLLRSTIENVRKTVKVVRAFNAADDSWWRLVEEVQAYQGVLFYGPEGGETRFYFERATVVGHEITGLEVSSKGEILESLTLRYQYGHAK